jgi:hypothetical protein
MYAYKFSYAGPLEDLPPLTVFPRLADYADVFSPETIRALSTLNATLSAIPSRLAMFQQMYGGRGAKGVHADGFVGKPTELEWSVKFISAGCLQMLERAHESLVRDGGTAPEPDPEDMFSYPDLPRLSARVQERFDRRWHRLSNALARSSSRSIATRESSQSAVDRPPV